MTADASSSPGPAPRVALVHDWLTGMRGGEKVLDALCELFPEAPLYTLLHVKGSVSQRIESRRIVTSPVQRLPGARRLYRHLLPLYPAVVETFDFEGYDLVVSSSHCAVKSVVTPHAVHVCYCHSPMRYAWDQFGEYFGPRQVGAVASRVLRPVMAAMARWDAATAYRPSRFVANSQYVAGRIGRYYNRRSTVVYPPVDTEFFRPSDDEDPPASSARHVLVVSALVPYKRVDLAIDACRKLRVPLKIAGSGPELARLRARTAGGEVEFLGWKSDEETRQLYRAASAVLLPGVEDFGLVPVEAQACGTPVVALGEGGACETVVPGVTGTLAAGRSLDAFADALERALATPFDRAAIRANAVRFSRPRFLTEFRAIVDDALNGAGLAEATRRRENSPESGGSAARWPQGGFAARRENKR
ncbi:MAG TPA: glycosyltransferase [Vicinamibacterales bacterium]|nr:glycosyltransferase [Vicinamibacterales bacterium]